MRTIAARVFVGKQVLDDQELIRPASKLLNRKIDQALTVPSNPQTLSRQKPSLFAWLESSSLSAGALYIQNSHNLYKYLDDEVE
jgi:hypothetical protein